MIENFIMAVCSANPRPCVHNNKNPHGAESWRKDAYHAARDPERTYCGIDRRGWLTINDEMPMTDAFNDFNFCLRCQKSILKDKMS